MMEQQALSDSNFDALSLRKDMWDDLKEGRAELVCRSCQFAKVIYIKKGSVEPPWDLWGRIFMWLGYPNVPNFQGQQTKWRVFWFPATTKRMYPPAETQSEVGPASLNGGYSYPCHSDAIVIYRLEEATRVLIHEVLHASCCDPQGAPLPLKEANTETWAEILLVALLSEGSEKEAERLWKIQSEWIANQNAILRNRFGIQGPEDYAWRYTLGRELILDSLKIDLPLPTSLKLRSSRLTSPDLYP